MKMKKIYIRQLNLRNFMRIQEVKKMKKQLSKVPNVKYNEFENSLERNSEKRHIMTLPIF